MMAAMPDGKRAMRVAGAAMIVLAAGACSSAHPSGTPADTTRPSASTRSTTRTSSPVALGPAVTRAPQAGCRRTPITFPALGQHLRPVSVPCYCPTARVTPAPTDAAARRAAVHAAMAWVTKVRHWKPGSGELSTAYRVAYRNDGNYGTVFANAAAYCGNAVFALSYGVEIVNPDVLDTGRRGDVVVAHFAGGWQVWGSYHP
jgi:hypothetical protein